MKIRTFPIHGRGEGLPKSGYGDDYEGCGPGAMVMVTLVVIFLPLINDHKLVGGSPMVGGRRSVGLVVVVMLKQPTLVIVVMLGILVIMMVTVILALMMFIVM